MSSKRKVWTARIVKLENGKQKLLWWGGRFDSKRERDAALAEARRTRPWEDKPTSATTCDELCVQYLEDYAANNKASSADTARLALVKFRAAFGARSVDSVARIEAVAWAKTVPRSYLPVVVALFAYAVDLELIDRNPFRGLGGGRGRGRADQNPPTEKQLEALLDACDALGDYAEQMRALILVGAYTGCRPGELHALRWTDIDFAASEVTISRRLYRGRHASPKSGKTRVIALPPPARDLLLRQPTRASELVFLSPRGCQLTSSTVSQYWSRVKARAGLDFDIYLVTRHLAVHNLWKLGLSKRTIAHQLGWSEKSVDDLLVTYSHQDVAARNEILALYVDGNDPLQIEAR